MQLTLPARYYTDEGIFRDELERFYCQMWVCAGRAEQLAEKGQFFLAEVADESIIVTRDATNTPRAFYNVCRHRGARLLEEGSGHCQSLRCPYHLWTYGHDGRLRVAPWFGDDPGFRLDDWPLQSISVDTWRGLLFVAIAPETSLIEQLGDLPEEVADFPIESFQAVAGERFLMSANWKTYTDNFIEGYHVPGIHPAFSKVIQFEKFETVARRGLVRMTAPQRSGSIYGGKWLWMWPSWTLSVFPGGMNTSRINPTNAGETELVYHFYFADTSEATAAARAQTIATNCGIVREDFGICEHTQRNYASGAYIPGPLSPRHEQSVAYFQGKVLEALRGRGARAAE